MTKKDYELIAQVLNTFAHVERENVPFMMDDIISSMSVALAKDNERFNKDIFYSACYKTS